MAKRQIRPTMAPWGHVEPDYVVRFIAKRDQAELVNLYHLAQTALYDTSGPPGSPCRPSKYDRMLWASREFHKAHPEVSNTGAYKDLDGLLS